MAKNLKVYQQVYTTEDTAQLVESLPATHEALGAMNGLVVHACSSST